ncbi:MAG: response regulator [Saccharofermentans sp.]|nr:response regulator [Saccharofermentans sp.]
MKRFRTISHFKKRVLIADDEDINRQILGNMLWGTYDVDLACDGKEAWDKINQEGSDYSLILSDLLMPETSGMRDILQQFNVGSFQGYYNAKPLKFDEFVEWKEGN